VGEKNYKIVFFIGLVIGIDVFLWGIGLKNDVLWWVGILLILCCATGLMIMREPEEESEDDFRAPAKYKEPYKIEFIGEGKVKLKKLPRRKVR